MKKLPIVALIGQTNAGKSSILNRFAHRNIAIVAREEGTTRDNVMTRIDDRFLLIDTAGLKDPNDDFEAGIQDQIADAIDAADLILLTLDSSKYPDDKDKQIAKSALKSRKPVLLLLNKSDLGESLPDEEFLRLGIKPDQTFRLSATTGQGFKDLKTAILRTLGESSRFFDANLRTPAMAGPATADVLKIALIGRPNVGKSSLFNSLGQKQQALVSSRQGTTR
ncbi:GTPase, partial [uncultured Bacteroides sp.]|uniref:GTPase n=1 Tax=uncultured Bacteroides sp. TaxID=162156 RepID=UPI00272A359E